MNAPKMLPLHEASSSPSSAQAPGTGRKPYARPKLENFGDLRDITLGPSPGLNESGNPYTLKK